MIYIKVKYGPCRHWSDRAVLRNLTSDSPVCVLRLPVWQECNRTTQPVHATVRRKRRKKLPVMMERSKAPTGSSAEWFDSRAVFADFECCGDLRFWGFEERKGGKIGDFPSERCPGPTDRSQSRRHMQGWTDARPGPRLSMRLIIIQEGRKFAVRHLINKG